MEQSIAKHVIKNMASFVAVTLIVTFVVMFFLVKNTVMQKEMYILRWAVDMASVTTAWYMEDSDMSFNDPRFAQQFTEKYNNLCNRYGLEYIYIYKFDTEKQEMTYVLLAGEADKQDEIRKTQLNKPSSTKFAKESSQIWNGEQDFLVVQMKNRYGYELGMWKLITDEDGNKAILGVDRSVDDFFREYLEWFLLLAFIEFLGIALVFLYTYKTIMNNIMNPVQKISTVMKDFVASGCRGYIAMQDNKYVEFQKISESFNSMAQEIHQHIDDITKLTKEKERHEAELCLSEQIQKGLLPAAIYNTPYFEISAMMKTARQVGGDLYDYLEVDDDNTLLVIADVSGKGVSAGIFMSMTLAMIRQLAGMGKHPDEIMTLVNRTICQNNPQGMFVTAFVAEYNHTSQQLSYANAGHNLPYVLQDDTIIKLDKCLGVPLGMFDDEVYEQADMQLLPGNILYMYTDGVTEAINGEKEFYGTERLEKTLESFTKSREITIIRYVYDSLKAFCGETEQSDDITMLSLNITNRCELLLDAEIDQFAAIREFILHSIIPKKLKLKLCLACEEWFTNICMYSYDQAAEKKKIKFTCEITDHVTIVFEDWGKPYNPLEKVISSDEYDFDTQVGGLGKLIIVSIADKVDYNYLEGRNILTITKNQYVDK